MHLTLNVVAGRYGGKKIPVTNRRFLIGRAEDCDLRPSSDSVSRHHCVVLLGTNVACVCDLGSKSGTFVNGEPVVGEHRLTNGDQLRVGPLQFEIHLIDLANVSARREDRGTESEIVNWLTDSSPRKAPDSTTDPNSTREPRERIAAENQNSADTAKHTLADVTPSTNRTSQTSAAAAQALRKMRRKHKP